MIHAEIRPSHQRKIREVAYPLTLQFRLLEALMQKPEFVWSRQDLIDAVWGQGAIVEPRTVDIHIAHIRRALVRHGQNLVRTAQGRGYALDQWADPLQ